MLELEATTGETAGRTRDLWAGPTPVTLELATNAAFTKDAVTVAAGSTVRLYARSTGTDTGSGIVWPVPRLAPVRLVRAGADGSVIDRRQGHDRRERRVDGDDQAGAKRRLRGALRRRRPVRGSGHFRARDHHRQVGHAFHLRDAGRMRKSAFTVHRNQVDLALVADDVVRRYEGTAATWWKARWSGST